MNQNKVKRLKISLIGTGNVAWHLASALIGNSSFELYSVYGRNKVELNKFHKTFKINCSDIIESVINADLIIICITDNEILNLIERLKMLNLKNKIFVNTAASINENVLLPLGANFGVFYPLQSLKKGIKVDMLTVPIGISGSNVKSLKVLKNLSVSIGSKWFEADFAMRMKLHIGAIISNNFTNYLFIIANDWCKKNGLDFKLLLPLILNGVSKLGTQSPESLQTGPASRGDTKVINSHLKILKNDKETLKLYKQFSKNIASHFVKP
jgi:predicted short-subunit dehydrogenase-like oxidoreductase (DUF2520 family)